MSKFDFDFLQRKLNSFSILILVFSRKQNINSVFKFSSLVNTAASTADEKTNSSICCYGPVEYSFDKSGPTFLFKVNGKLKKLKEFKIRFLFETDSLDTWVPILGTTAKLFLVNFFFEIQNFHFF